MSASSNEHRQPELVESILDPDPVRQFHRWFAEATAAGVPQPNAMTLATATPDGRPSARVVLLKNADGEGFKFFTNYTSRKGRELAANPFAALVFHWEELGRQVRVEGPVERLSAQESDTYFASRPPDNRRSSLASAQSEEATREELDARFEALKQQYAEGPVPRPDYWGGYRVRPARMEFWQRRFARLNDRILYRRTPENLWSITRLAP
jgi:pyridoxamine 5'-phosphate oxidase